MMDEDTAEPSDVFRIPDLWAPSKCLSLGPDYTSFLFSALELHDVDIKLPAIVPITSYDDPFFGLPELPFEFSESLPKSVEFTLAQEDKLEHDKSSREEREDSCFSHDFWLLPEEQPLKDAAFQTWNSFDNTTTEDVTTPYITESGATTFDAAIATEEDYLRIANSEHVLVDSRAYITALLALGLGRSSVFFEWNQTKSMFHSTLEKCRISGHSGEVLGSAVVLFMDCGNASRFLQNFVDKAYQTHWSPGEVALADSISTLVVSIQTHLSASGSKVASILQLEALFKPAHTILATLQRLVRSASSARNDEAMLSTIFQETQILEHRTDYLRQIMFELLSRVTKPWLEFSSEWLGLRREVGLPMSKIGSSKGFVKTTNKEWVNEQGEELSEPDFILDYDRVPSFISPDDARSLFEVGRSIRFLRTYHPDHPLSRSEIVASAKPPSLDWSFSWEDIVHVENKACQYENNLISAIRKYSADPSSLPDDRTESMSQEFQLEFFGKPAEDMEAHFLASVDAFNQEPHDTVTSNRLSDRVVKFLQSTVHTSGQELTFAPPIALAPLLSFNPIIAAQARVVNGTCIRMFFNSHKIRDHLNLQRDFHLFGNGVFSSRLSHALFDPDMESAERQRGVARSGGVMGLRLGGRDTWPPASSELRLALMGILTESYGHKKSPERPHVGTFLDATNLPGDLSFAVRDMSDEEIQRCLDPDSNEALDFLRLSYKAPAPLDAVITPIALFKYDQMFKLLLRVLRMVYVTTALFREASPRVSSWRTEATCIQRFHFEAQHFISSISEYFFLTGVETTWKIFQSKLDEVEARIKSDDAYSLGADEGLDKLRDYHEMVLDKMMFSLLLRKRQQPVMNLLEEIFALILQFSTYCKQQISTSETSTTTESKVDIKALYKQFRHKLSVFVNVCRGMSEKKGYGEHQLRGRRRIAQSSLFDGSDLAEENTIVQLLARLEMSDYYTRSNKK